jgi:AraC family transcriptional regulator
MKLKRMDISKKGKFYGITNTVIQLEGVGLTDTVYTQPAVGWHYHENPYFTFILQGNLTEGNKKEIYNCGPGSLLFHNWHEPHYNIKPDGFARGFHIEIEPQWLTLLNVDISSLKGSLNITHPDIKLLAYSIFRESKVNDNIAGLVLNTLLAEVFSKLGSYNESAVAGRPQWVTKIKEILHDRFADTLTLNYLAETASVHPTHLSRNFKKYFHCTIGEYLRKIRIEKALAMMSQPNIQLTDIALQCGFYDQSHFIRCFREAIALNPLAYKKVLQR